MRASAQVLPLTSWPNSAKSRLSPLNSPALVEADRLMRFNVVVANPPFSLDKWGAAEAQADRYNRFWRGVPPKSKGDYALVVG